MKKLFLFIITSIVIFPIKSQVMWQFNKDTVVTWDYQWGDEFNGEKVDEEKWSFWYGWARSIFGNKEQLNAQLVGTAHVAHNFERALVFLVQLAKNFVGKALFGEIAE